jgi:hypothetical protein
MLIDLLDEAGVIEVTRNAAGEPIKVRQVKLAATLGLAVDLDTKVIRREENVEQGTSDKKDAPGGV